MWRTDSSAVAAVLRPPADGGGAEAAESGRSFSAQQSSSHQGQTAEPLKHSDLSEVHSIKTLAGPDGLITV